MYFFCWTFVYTMRLIVLLHRKVFVSNYNIQSSLMSVLTFWGTKVPFYANRRALVLISTTKCLYIAIGCVAQLVERLAYNEGVSGSNPFAPILWRDVFTPLGVDKQAPVGANRHCKVPLFLQRPKGPVAPNGVFLSWLKCLYTLKLEAWLSGLRHRFAKSAYIVYVPWVQIPLLPKLASYKKILFFSKDIS